MGDLNLPNINWDNWTYNKSTAHNLEHRFIECIRDCFLFQHVCEPTRKRGSDKPSTLDLLFTNEEHMIQNLEINSPVGNSDHAVLNFDFMYKSDYRPPKLKIYYQKGDYEKMKDLLNIDWELEFSKYPNDVEKQWSVNKIHQSGKRMCTQENSECKR